MLVAISYMPESDDPQVKIVRLEADLSENQMIELLAISDEWHEI